MLTCSLLAEQGKLNLILSCSALTPNKVCLCLHLLERESMMYSDLSHHAYKRQMALWIKALECKQRAGYCLGTRHLLLILCRESGLISSFISVKCRWYFSAPNWELRNLLLFEMCLNTVAAGFREAPTGKIPLCRLQLARSKWRIMLYQRVTNKKNNSQWPHLWSTAHLVLWWMQLYCRK